MEPTSFSLEVGQFNSRAFDSKIGFSQQISFPQVYKNQRKWLNEQSVISSWEKDMKIQSLQAEVSRRFYAYLFLVEKEKLLMKADSIYTLFSEKSKLRFQNGETGQLESVSAEIQLKQINNHLKTL